jgi:hypothetical protein
MNRWLGVSRQCEQNFGVRSIVKRRPRRPRRCESNFKMDLGGNLGMLGGWKRL